MRQKQCNLGTVNKYIAFLNILKEKGDYGQSLKELVNLNSINKSVIIAVKKLNIIYWTNDLNWHWIAADADKQLALEVLNFCLELGKKQIVTPITGLDDELKTYIREIRDHLISNSQSKQSGLDGLKLPLLSKALNQENPTHLFSQVESNEAKKFELLKAVASGVYSNNLNAATLSFRAKNENIISATEDLFNKFFKVK